MLRVLFDKNVPYVLRHHLIDYQVQTADDEGWGQVSNGELIGCAEKAGYQIMLTSDQNIQYQQNRAHRTISMVVLGSNIWPSIDRKSTRLNSSHLGISYAVFCLKKKITT